MTTNGALVALVRNLRDKTQEEVAETANLKQGYLSLIEAGLRQPSPDALIRIAEVLDVPPDLLEDQTPIRGGEAQDLHFRKRKTLAVKERKRLEAKLHLTYLSVKGLLRGIDYQPSLPLPPFDIDESGDAAEAARHMRRLWRIPTGPVPSLRPYLEGAGIFLVGVAAPGKIDAVTRRGEDGDGWHVTLFNRDMPVDRMRLTDSHELAHLVLHARSFGKGDETESDANTFAAEFLVPADEIEPDLRGLTPRHLSRLLDLRLHWKVSVPFLVRRAQDLDLINERTARSLYTSLNAQGWLHSTVDDRIPREPATMLDSIIAVHRDQHHYSDADLAAGARMTPRRFNEQFGAGPSEPPRLVRVK